MIRRMIKITGVVIIISIALYLIFNKIDTKARLDLIFCQGQVSAEPFTKEKFCNHKYNDGGKKCSDGSQCSSNRCIVYEYEKQNGVCAEYETIFGCYSFLKQGKLTESICYD